MFYKNDNEMILSLIKLTEAKLKWGSGNNWSTQDFEAVSVKVMEVTGINLSLTTLKRLWGKIKYESKPTVTTLNALAQFNGFENWRAFQQSQNNNPQEKKVIIKPDRKVAKRRSKLFILVPVVLVLVAAFFLFVTNKSSATDFSEAEFLFSSKKMVFEGVPNSVIFNYNASSAGLSDKVEIQQSWDERLRAEVPKNKFIHNSIYYYPGFFKAKLVISDTIVKEHGILIKTKGWLPLIEKDITKPPIYFKKEDIFSKDGLMSLPIEKIKAVNVELKPEPTWTSFYNINDFGNVLSEDFVFETEFKNDYTEAEGICQYTNLLVYFEGAMLYLPFSLKGCVSNLALYDVNGKMDIDVSALGYESGQWMKLKVEVIKGRGKIYINDVCEYDFNYHFEDPAKFVGLSYSFQGTGSVKYTKFTDGTGSVAIDEVY